MGFLKSFQLTWILKNKIPKQTLSVMILTGFNLIFTLSKLIPVNPVLQYFTHQFPNYPPTFYLSSSCLYSKDQYIAWMLYNIVAG